MYKVPNVSSIEWFHCMPPPRFYLAATDKRKFFSTAVTGQRPWNEAICSSVMTHINLISESMNLSFHDNLSCLCSAFSPPQVAPVHDT